MMGQVITLASRPATLTQPPIPLETRRAAAMAFDTDGKKAEVIAFPTPEPDPRRGRSRELRAHLYRQSGASLDDLSDDERRGIASRAQWPRGTRQAPPTPDELDAALINANWVDYVPKSVRAAREKNTPLA